MLRFRKALVSLVLAMVLIAATWPAAEAAVPSELTFKVMLSTNSGGQLTQVDSAQMVVSADGVVYGTYYATSGGMLEFNIPTSGTVTWALTTGSLAVRHFSSSLSGGFLVITDTDINVELYYRENGDGSYYFEYYRNNLYITNQGNLGAIILGELKQASTSNALAETYPLGAPSGTLTVGGGRKLTESTTTTPPNNFGDLGSGTDGKETVGGIVFTGLGDVGGTTGENSSTSDQINAAIAAGGDVQLNRLASFSYDSSGEVPGLVLRWTYPSGNSDSWFMPLGASGSLAVAILYQTTLGASNAGIPTFSLMMRLGNAFLSGLASGTHKLTYYLVNSSGVQSNYRWEFISIN